MRGFRAKDADRDRYVEVIEAAWVDGQLGDADRDLRVSRALSAETLDELETLTRDLQNRPGRVVVDEPEPVRVARTPAPRTQSSDSPPSSVLPGRPGRWIAGVAVVVVGLAGLAAAGSHEDDFATEYGIDSGWFDESGEAVPFPDEVVDEASFTLTKPEVRQVLRAYERKFGTTEAWEAAFYPERVIFQVPQRGSKPRAERWTWDGAWRRTGAPSAVRGRNGLNDLDTLDVRRLFANIETARTSLDVDDAELTYAIVTSAFGGPVVNVHVANELSESGFLTTTLEGDVVRRHPYVP